MDLAANQRLLRKQMMIVAKALMLIVAVVLTKVIKIKMAD